MLRPAGSKVKTVLAPMRVMVASAAVNSTRDPGPVRTRSGALKSSLVFAGAAAWVEAVTTFASLMISVKTLSVSGVAACAVRLAHTSKLRNVVLMFAPGWYGCGHLCTPK